MSEEQANYQCNLSAQELRIGNWVYDGERTSFPMQVVAIGKDWVHLDFPGNEGGVWEADIKDLRPIVFTEETMEKAGFNYQYPYYRKEWDNRAILYSYRWGVLRVVEFGAPAFLCKCRYLHQLQNAYYMATGEELDV